MGILSKSGLNPGGRATDEGFVDIESVAVSDLAADADADAGAGTAAPDRREKTHLEDNEMPDLDCAGLARGIAAALDRFLAERPKTSQASVGTGILDSWRAQTYRQHILDCRDHALMLARAFEQGGAEQVNESALAFAQSASLAGGVLSRVKLSSGQQEALAAVSEQAGTLAGRIKISLPDIAKTIGQAIEQLMNRLIKKGSAPAQSAG